MAQGITPERKRARYLMVLRRRAAHLEQRIASLPDIPGISWDKRELNALRWIFDIVEAATEQEGATP